MFIVLAFALFSNSAYSQPQTARAKKQNVKTKIIEKVVEIDLDIAASKSYIPKTIQSGLEQKTDGASLMQEADGKDNASDESLSFRKTTSISNKMIVVMFNQNSSDLYDDMKRRIKKMAAEIRNRKYDRVIVEGFASPDEYNIEELSARRAKAVYDELLLDFIDAKKLEYIGLGAKLPIESNKTPNGRQSNRRVELIVE